MKHIKPFEQYVNEGAGKKIRVGDFVVLDTESGYDFTDTGMSATDVYKVKYISGRKATIEGADGEFDVPLHAIMHDS